MTCAVLFARDPVPGRVKTRLQSHLGAHAAAALYAAFVLDSVAGLRASAARRKVVAAADAGGLPGLRRLLGAAEGGLEFVAQPEGGLGERMRGVLQGVFAAGADRAVVLGSDSPSIPPGTIDAALTLLEQTDVVLGPSVDGGYYLVGLRSSAFAAAGTPMFGNPTWSTGLVLEQTVAALPDGVRLRLLPAWYDVDLPPEAAFLRSHLAALERAGQPVARHSLAALRKLDLPPPS